MKTKLACITAAALFAASPFAMADDPTVAYLWPTPSGSDHKQGVFTGVGLRGDYRKTCTFELWFCPLSDSLSSHLMEQYNADAGRMNLTRSGSTHKLGLWMGGYDGASMTSNAELPLKQWTHVAWVADGDVWRFYINGELDSETTGHASHLMPQNPDGIAIGNSWKSNYNGNSAGYYAEARAWKCARTGAQIKEWMNKRIENPLAEPDLVGYWPIADGDAAASTLGVTLRNYAVPGVATPSYGLVRGGKLYGADANYIVWSQGSAAYGGPLPVAGTLPADQTALYNLGIHHDVASDIGDWTNAVSTGVSATPENFTFMGWYLVGASTPGRSNCLFGKMVYANGRATFGENNGNLSLWMGGGLNGATNESITATSAMPLRRWTHVALVKRGGTVRIYTNGDLAAEADGFALNLCNAELQLGGYQTGNNYAGFYGAMKNVGFWSKAMDAEHIRKYMTALPDPDDPKLLGYWPFDDGSGNAARNLKTGASAGVPLGNGSFYWATSPNMPVVKGTVQPDVFVMVVR